MAHLSSLKSIFAHFSMWFCEFGLLFFSIHRLTFNHTLNSTLAIVKDAARRNKHLLRTCSYRNQKRWCIFNSSFFSGIRAPNEGIAILNFRSPVDVSEHDCIQTCSRKWRTWVSTHQNYFKVMKIFLREYLSELMMKNEKITLVK